MTTFLQNPNLLVEEFNEMTSIAQRKAFITVDLEIQEEEVRTLELYRGDLHELKKEFVRNGLEREANLVYCIGGALLAVQLEIKMLVNIKQGKMSEAWENLVSSQGVYGIVLRNTPFKIKSGYGYLERLNEYENLLFPKMFFSSIGGIIKKSICSICNEGYGKCDHLKGRLYNGELCVCVITEMEIEEISLVDEPANKNCRMLSTTYNGKTVDLLTLKEKPQTESKT